MEARGPEIEDDAVRFEDLTVDDDLPIIDRIVHYTSSQIALQRLVHVKMLAETAELAGKHATQKVLIPMLEHLLGDAEAVIRQHIAGQLLTLSVVAIYNDRNPHQSVVDYLQQNTCRNQKAVDPAGYQLICETVIQKYLALLVRDPEVDVRRAAADSLAGLVVHMRAEDILAYSLPIATELAAQKPAAPSTGKKRTGEEQRLEELRITACHVLAEMGGSASEQQRADKDDDDHSWVQEAVVPAVLELVKDDSFRVRRAAAQALPRVMGASSLQVTESQLLPAFESLSHDEVHRVRKSVGECLVDMSRALMLISNNEKERTKLLALRRKVLLPIADRLIQDSHKQVRQGMMQFLGPFMASFYPYQYSPLHTLLPASIESDGSHHMGIVAQFFPHASSMVARLNSSQNAIASTPTPVHSSVEPFFPKPITDLDRVQRALPAFLHAARMSALSLAAVTSHRQTHPPDQEDLQALGDVLLDFYAALSVVSTGDENTDAEMRVYCAYSFPALVLLLGRENWEGSMQTCFFTLLNPRYGQDEGKDESNNSSEEGNEAPEPPLPVKRCLASSLHTVAHILGPELAARDILPAVREYFLHDADDSVRLNMIRNFAALLQVLPAAERDKTFLIWSEVVQGDGFLGGSRKRSASNPLVLNWRQRDYLARTIPDLIGLVRPRLLRDHIWPIIQILLTDSINDVRDDALWSVAILIKAYCADTVQRWIDVADAKKFSAENCAQVVDWILENVLKSGGGTASTNPQQGGNKSSTPTARPTNFTDRQVFCRICASLGLALRLSEDSSSSAASTNLKDPVSVLSAKFKSLFYKNSEAQNATDSGPYQKMTTAERKHVRKVLMDDLLPLALEMKEDRISNVRITLMKVLQIMPFDIRTAPKVKSVLKGLEEEAETWTSFGEEVTMTAEADEQTAAEAAATNSRESHGPVDMDITPASSRDEDDDPPASPKKKKTATAIASGKSLMSGVDTTSAPTEKLRAVVFEDGPIGMQLEPTADDSAGRIYEFNDVNGKKSPALASGKIKIGDVIVSVNHVKVKSYDETIHLLKAGGSRIIVVRDGVDSDVADDEDGPSAAASSESDDEAEKLRKKKEAKKAKKAKKEKKLKKDAGEDGSDDASVGSSESPPPPPPPPPPPKKKDKSEETAEERKARKEKKAKKLKKEAKEGKEVKKTKKAKDEG